MSKAIAVVEDDESIREMLRYYFQSVGYAVRAYESGEALFAGEEGLGLPALYILDIMLPGMDGLEILRRLREGRDTAAVPVIMLTARSAEMDRVAGLENGADDYVVKPFGIMELQARVKAVLRRTERRGDRVLTWGDVELNACYMRMPNAAKGSRDDSRIVPIRDDILPLLRAWKEEDEKQGCPWVIHWQGRPVRCIGHAWHQARKAAGITRRITPYSLRHAMPTEALEHGADVQAVAEVMGHADPTMLLRVYQHTRYRLRKKAVNAAPGLKLDKI